MVFPVFPNHITTAMTSLQLASFWILPQVNNVAAYTINLILHQTQWVAHLFSTADLVYKGSFVFHEEQWKSCETCLLTFAKALNFNLLSQLFLCFLTFAKFRIIADPFKSNMKKLKKYISGLVQK